MEPVSVKVSLLLKVMDILYKIPRLALSLEATGNMLAVLTLLLNHGAKTNDLIIKGADEKAVEDPTHLNVKMLELLKQAKERS
jgi:hypothetical protein